jgi:hypothetical protein
MEGAIGVLFGFDPPKSPLGRGTLRSFFVMDSVKQTGLNLPEAFVGIDFMVSSKVVTSIAFLHGCNFSGFRF